MDSLENQKKQGSFWDIDTGLDLFNIPELISANNFAGNLKPYQKSLKLDWNLVFISPDPSPYPDRVNVIVDAAMAIEYLHHGNDTPIVHCDLKPANVLLDEDMVAHVGDFGISKILAISKSMAHTETLCTLGYIALEYGSEGIVTTSVDVYSYGIMLMEVLTKRRPTDEEICNENLGLRKWIIQSFSGTMMDIIDDNLFHEEEQITSKSEICIASMFELALDCTMEMPESRITMKDVVKRLKKSRTHL
ncbi:putative ABC transporter A family member 1-like [Capsicum annuum]|uniref:non-specific serine/threonine protein kinase n=1 Tax=Capsicum annuum TaxID=4072 RepID=A0A2G2ZFF3_CAPAN|nr:putative ABC transporter A family member 1-like [Capsicum annuum]KAF3631387.1 putative ABC transporter A family member 1-like [Capsicum annuum]PHT80708.1 hypothetical protein T459_13723 [Capsicum annuum]